MSRVALITSSEIPRDVLATVVSPDDDLRVVVVAVEQSVFQWLANDEGEARGSAERVAGTVTSDAPVDATTTEVKVDAPEQLVRDAIAEHDPDRVVVALRTGEEARWLEAGELPSEIDGVPIVCIGV